MYRLFNLSRVRIVILTLVCLCLSLAAFALRSAHAISSGTPITPPLQNRSSSTPPPELTQEPRSLRGEEAIKQLKQEGTYDSLKEAMRKSELARAQATGRADKAQKPALPNIPLVGAPPLGLREIKLPASDLVPNDQFGATVAISGNTAIVGGYRDSFLLAYEPPSAAHIFVRDGANWIEQAKLEGDVPHSLFGTAVAISGDTAVVGDSFSTFRFEGDDSLVFTNSAVYVYVRHGKSWTREAKLQAPETPTAFSNDFGFSVAISDDTLIVGMTQFDEFHQGRKFGKAYVYERDNGSWVQQAGLVADDRQVNDFFGFSVAVSGDTAVVGTPFKKVGPNEYQGQAYVYTRVGESWSSLPKKLTGSSSGAGDNFAGSVAVSGQTLIVGAYGLAYTFNRSGADWIEQQILFPADNQATSHFGDRVDISDDTAVVGAYQFNVAGKPKQGAVSVFARVDGIWVEREQLIASDGAAGDIFGSDVAVSGNNVIVGANGRDFSTPGNQGAAYLFRVVDSDEDGLPDEWEKNGVTIAGVFIDLKKMGADPMHKDIFIHADWMATGPSGMALKPNPSAIKMMIDSFARASSVVNPDGKIGVRLHIDLGRDSIMNPESGEKWQALSRSGEVPFQPATGSLNGGIYVWNAVDLLKPLHFSNTRRRAIFHYAVFCNRLPSGLNAAGISRGIPGVDLAIGINVYKKRDGSTRAGKAVEQALDFMHELGHNLGLRHGGGDNIQNKPNYLSIMNPRFAYSGLLLPGSKKRGLDYSGLKLPTLDEVNLDEAIGINDPGGHLTTWNPLTRKTTPAGFNKCSTNLDGFYKILPYPAVDWNCDGLLTPGTVTADLNSDGRCVRPGPGKKTLDTTIADLGGDDEIRDSVVTDGANRACETAAKGNDVALHLPIYLETDELQGFNDWRALDFEGGGRLGVSARTSTTTQGLARIGTEALTADGP